MPEAPQQTFTWPGWELGGRRDSVERQNIGATVGQVPGSGFGPFRPAPAGGTQPRSWRWGDNAYARAASRQRMMMPSLMSMFPENTALSISDIPAAQTELGLQTWLQNVMHERPRALEHLGGRPEAYGQAQAAAQQLMDPTGRNAAFQQLASALRGQGSSAAGMAQGQLRAQMANRGIGGNLADYQQALLGQTQRQTLAGQLADLRGRQQELQDQAYGTGAGILGGLSELDMAAREALARLAIEQPITMPDLSALMAAPPVGGETEAWQRSVPAGVGF